MISKASCLSHTKASIKYGWNNEKDAEIVFNQNLIGDNPAEISKEFAMIQRLNTVCIKNTISIVISPCIEDKEKLNKRLLKNICERFMEKLQLGDRQAIGFTHNDKAHLHIHLYANRIDFHGKAYNDSFISKECQRIAKEIAKELNLTTVEEIQIRQRNKTKAIRNEILKNHQAAIKKRPKNIDEYFNLLKQKKIEAIPIINKSNQLQGFRYKFKNSEFKGSEVNRKLTGSNLIKQISLNSKIIKNDKIKIGSNFHGLHPNLEKALKRDNGNNRGLNR